MPAAILFDLINGGAKDWSENPYKRLGQEALANAAVSFELGRTGAGTGATTATLMGGLGSASVVLPSGHTIGALVAVNALGSATVGASKHFWAAPFEAAQEFGGHGLPTEFPQPHIPPTQPPAHPHTTTSLAATPATPTHTHRPAYFPHRTGPPPDRVCVPQRPRPSWVT